MRKFAIAFAIVTAFAGTAHAERFKGYANEAAAERACRSPVVWANPDSRDHLYHVKGSRWYGNTKIGAFVCQAAAERGGYHQAMGG